MLDAGADKLVKARRYECSPERVDRRAGTTGASCTPRRPGVKKIANCAASALRRPTSSSGGGSRSRGGCLCLPRRADTQVQMER